MAPNSLSPASVVIAYHTSYGAHRMTIPTLAWSPVSSGGTIGSYIAWNLTTIDTEAMVNDLVNNLIPFVPSSTVFDDVTVYTKDTPTADNIPRANAVIGTAGTGSAGNMHEATSGTFNFKTLANGDMRVVLLDFPITTTFRAIHPAAFDANMLALEAAVVNVTNAWSGRDDARPSALRKITLDLNDELQKQYKLSA